MSRKIAFLIVLLLVSANAFAQVEQGAITGIVVDPTGASIPKANVTATNQATGTVAVAETTDDGYYKIPYLPAGKYNVAVTKDGFAINRVMDPGSSHRPQPVFPAERPAWSNRRRQHRDGANRERRPLQHHRHPARWAGHPEQLDSRQRVHASAGDHPGDPVHYQ